MFFTSYDEKTLSKVAPYVISSLLSSHLIEDSHSLLKDSHMQQKRLAALLEVAESLSCQLRMDVLVPSILNKACELVRADRCSLFMLNESRDRLVTSFQGGLDCAIEIPIGAGIVGSTAASGEVINIADAYQDPRFDRATDLATGYRTLSILSAPIFDEMGNVIGVTEMINKADDEMFSADDEKMIKVFNVFTGISIENARLYDKPMMLNERIEAYNEMTRAVAAGRATRDVLRCIRRVI